MPLLAPLNNAVINWSKKLQAENTIAYHYNGFYWPYVIIGLDHGLVPSGTSYHLKQFFFCSVAAYPGLDEDTDFTELRR